MQFHADKLLLNANWDKIDLDSKSKGNAISSIEGEGKTNETVKGNTDKIAVLNGTGAIKEKANKEDLTTLSNSVTSSLADNSKQVPHLGTTTNSGDIYSITTTQVINANQKFTIKFNANSITAPTLKINSGAVCAIKKANGNNAKLYASVYTLFWDGTSFTLLGEGGDYGTATKDKVLEGNTIGTETGIVAGTIPIIIPTLSDTVAGNSTVYSGFGDGLPYALLSVSSYYNNVSWIRSAQPDLIASNILSGKNVLGLVGTAINGAGMKKIAGGSIPAYNYGWADFSGLTFRPRVIIIVSKYSPLDITLYKENNNPGIMYFTYSMTENTLASTGAWVSDTGFHINVAQHQHPYNWLAME
ncbi:hypothetical protein [Clostridium sp. CF012]|uniref:hypothetical protein n=1 Tax=Clostridium sp. CF012 TaxID=2843319 RepID=UPI001C0B37B0|nr:hypothetical protein [Clostridium sp. CF012]MBU3145396.1 hypothetical protein [Clostridium sp. CF012]